jgi:hypothetical protein
LYKLCPGIICYYPDTALAFGSGVQDNYNQVPVDSHLLEFNLAVVASRSSLAGALLRSVSPPIRRTVVDFLRGLSLDELECLADFEGACTLEDSGSFRIQAAGCFSRYRLLATYFDPSDSDRWHNADDCAHKTFIVLAWLEYQTNFLRISPTHIH